MTSHGREDEEPLTPSRQNSNVFGDEYEVLDLDVADGFRPDDDRNDTETQSTHTVAAHYASNPVMTFSPDPMSRSSTRKSRTYDNPFTSPGDATLLDRTSSTRSSINYAPGIARRISSASSNHYAGTNSPRLGAAGPSHPYTMYPQGTIVRSPSVATASTARPTRRSSQRNAPQHPYAMYTQGIADGDEDEDEDEERAANPVPVGFGLGQTYRRVRGPEGEEQDIIGEYGHAEQLPPYSRYPEDGPEKAPLVTVPESMHSRAPVEGTDPGMPLMHERLSRQSMTDASNLEQTAPLLADHDSAISTSEESSSLGEKDWKEKSWREKSWKEKRKTRVCGIPFGWILIALATVGFIFAVLIGSLVGYLAGTHHKQSYASPTVTTSLHDASLLTATSGMSAPTSTYALTLSTPQATQAACLTNPAHQSAWDCKLAGKPAVAISVGAPLPPAAPTQGAYLFYGSTNTNISYGAQIQSLQTSFQPLLPVLDNDDPSLGPAMFFQDYYDKLVVLPSNTFSTSGKLKRQWAAQPDWAGRKQIDQPGERPWFCFFNHTALEGFIYIQRPAALNVTKNSTSSSAPSSTITSAPTTTYDHSYTGSYSFSGGSSEDWMSRAAAAKAAHTSSGLQARGQGPSFLEQAYAALSPYPFMIKLEERRIYNSSFPPAYCQQYQKLDNGEYGPALDGKGNPVKFDLEEVDPVFNAYPAGYAGSRRDTAPNGCHCQWVHGA